jgi:hypothetical protein
MIELEILGVHHKLLQSREWKSVWIYRGDMGYREGEKVVCRIGKTTKGVCGKIRDVTGGSVVLLVRGQLVRTSGSVWPVRVVRLLKCVK